jgi:hypothetical protein
MIDRKIILAVTLFLAGFTSWVGPRPLAAQTMPSTYSPYPALPVPQPAMQGAPYVFPPPVINAPPTSVPIYPLDSAVAPLPMVAPGPMLVPSGGSLSPQFGLPPGPEALPLPAAPGAVSLPPNPIVVPVADEELAWDQIVDVVSDYFTVARELRARRDGQVWTEGRIETAPQDGATWLEPHRGDSVGSFSRWESTFQTIRRRAVVRVIPDAAGYMVEVVVEKELEDLPSPEKSTAGAATFRTSDSLPSRRLEQISRTVLSPRWIQLGRDPPLEQRMLAEISARLGGIPATATPALAR